MAVSTSALTDFSSFSDRLRSRASSDRLSAQPTSATAAATMAMTPMAASAMKRVWTFSDFQVPGMIHMILK